MVCIYFNYEYSDMPMGDWTTNCFDGRFCEEDYAEKSFHFLTFSPVPLIEYKTFLIPLQIGYIHQIMIK